jgi:ubiquinone/menaquinone biosynthesis C-methylase UbiE
MAADDIRHPLVASGYDAVMAAPEKLLGLGRQRQRTLADASGRVLEIGFGTGLNLPHYPEVDALAALEPDPHMRERATQRIRSVAPGFPVELVPASAEEMPFPDDAFDTVVSTLVLCSVEDPRRALEEAHRVLAPDGQLLLLEHVRSRRPAVAWLQHALTPVWRNVAAGCHLDLQTVATAEDAGFRFDHLWRSRAGRGSFVQGRAKPAARPAS